MSAFPGLLGRGLIEGDNKHEEVMARIRILSPVYWAGASLKEDVRGGRAGHASEPFPGLLGRGLIEGAGRRARPAPAPPLSPVYWAGASLKGRGGRRASGCIRGFPRSTGPGPH